MQFHSLTHNIGIYWDILPMKDLCHTTQHSVSFQCGWRGCLAIRSSTMPVVLGLTAGTGPNFDGNSDGKIWNMNCNSPPFKFKRRIMTSDEIWWLTCYLFIRFWARSKKYRERPDHTHTESLQSCKLRLNLQKRTKHTHTWQTKLSVWFTTWFATLILYKIELSLMPTWDSYWIDLRNISRKPWFVPSKTFKFPIQWRTTRLATQGGDSISADSSLHLCREFPNHGYPWIQLPKSRKKSTIKFISYASSAWWDICELFLAALDRLRLSYEALLNEEKRLRRVLVQCASRRKWENHDGLHRLTWQT